MKRKEKDFRLLLLKQQDEIPVIIYSSTFLALLPTYLQYVIDFGSRKVRCVFFYGIFLHIRVVTKRHKARRDGADCLPTTNLYGVRY